MQNTVYLELDIAPGTNKFIINSWVTYARYDFRFLGNLGGLVYLFVGTLPIVEEQRKIIRIDFRG